MTQLAKIFTMSKYLVILKSQILLLFRKLKPLMWKLTKKTVTSIWTPAFRHRIQSSSLTKKNHLTMKKVFHKSQISHKIFHKNRFLKWLKKVRLIVSKLGRGPAITLMLGKKYSFLLKYVIVNAWKGNKLWAY